MFWYLINALLWLGATEGFVSSLKHYVLQNRSSWCRGAGDNGMWREKKWKQQCERGGGGEGRGAGAWGKQMQNTGSDRGVEWNQEENEGREKENKKRRSHVGRGVRKMRRERRKKNNNKRTWGWKKQHKFKKIRQSLTGTVCQGVGSRLVGGVCQCPPALVNDSNRSHPTISNLMTFWRNAHLLVMYLNSSSLVLGGNIFAYQHLCNQWVKPLEQETLLSSFHLSIQFKCSKCPYSRLITRRCSERSAVVFTLATVLLHSLKAGRRSAEQRDCDTSSWCLKWDRISWFSCTVVCLHQREHLCTRLS